MWQHYWLEASTPARIFIGCCAGYLALGLACVVISSIVERYPWIGRAFGFVGHALRWTCIATYVLFVGTGITMAALQTHRAHVADRAISEQAGRMQDQMQSAPVAHKKHQKTVKVPADEPLVAT